jgi:PKHD-type hydroxylase
MGRRQRHLGAVSRRSPRRTSNCPKAATRRQEAGAIVLDALGKSPLFFAAALPLKVFPPLFNRYGEGQTFGTHVDNAIRIQRGTEFRIRSDLSITVFLEDPAPMTAASWWSRIISACSGSSCPGHAVLYPSSSLHHVTPVTRGVRVASFFWLQSMIRDDGARRILFDLDQSRAAADRPAGRHDRSVIELTGVYHNLLGCWATPSSGSSARRMIRDEADHWPKRGCQRAARFDLVDVQALRPGCEQATDGRAMGGGRRRERRPDDRDIDRSLAARPGVIARMRGHILREREQRCPVAQYHPALLAIAPALVCAQIVSAEDFAGFLGDQASSGILSASRLRQ